MYRIRKKAKGAAHAVPKPEAVAPPDPAVPRYFARQCVMLLRLTHVAFDEMARLVQVMPPEQKALYQYLADVELRPSYFDAQKLLDQSEERDLFSIDEAATLRAGKFVDNPLPHVERNGDDLLA